MENQEKENKEPIISIIDLNPILDDHDYRVTGDDYYMYCAKGVTVNGPSLSDGVEAVKRFLIYAKKINEEYGVNSMRVYPPVGFNIPQAWIDEIYNE